MSGQEELFASNKSYKCGVGYGIQSIVLYNIYSWGQEMGGGGDRWELPGSYHVFVVVMVIYDYVEIIWKIPVTTNFLYNI